MFVVPKEGQPGQWQVITDMLCGGQNECIGADPCILPRTSHILDQMYAGEYSAVVDLSKYFHNFMVHPDDRKYLGLKHPVTGVMYHYHGLPVGSSSSSSLACQYGLSFVRMLKERFRNIKEKPPPTASGQVSHTKDMIQDLGIDVLKSQDGDAVLVWAFVDDFPIHGPNFDKTK